MIKLRYYLIFENTIKRFGLTLTRQFKEAASKVIPYLSVFFEEKNGDKRIIRLQLDEFHFNENGIRIPDINGTRYALEGIFNDVFETDTKDTSISLKNRRRIKLTNPQKHLLIERMKKDFGDAWDRIDPNEKLDFWVYGDTYADRFKKK